MTDVSRGWRSKKPRQKWRQLEGGEGRVLRKGIERFQVGERGDPKIRRE